MNFASLAIVGNIGRIGHREIYFSIKQSLMMLLTFDMSVVNGPVVAGADTAQITEVVENLCDRQSMRCCI